MIILKKMKEIGLDYLRRVHVVVDREMWLAVFIGHEHLCRTTNKEFLNQLSHC